MQPAPEASRPSGEKGAEFPSAVAAALLDPARPEPDCVSGPAGKAAGKRFDVYRNNVTVSLVNALAEIYPATQRIVGEEFFRGMARMYVRATPPASPLLFGYGRDYPAFIDRFEHTRDLPWLGDVARIERAWLDAYHAADSAVLAPQALSAIDQGTLGEARFVSHPATRIVRSRYPAVTIFTANRKDAPVGLIESSDAEDALVTRPELDVLVRWLPPGGAVFLSTLVAGSTLAEAAARAASDSEEFDLAANIKGSLEAGVFAEVIQPGAGA
ncbi:MAG: HvfC/BufC family peptide modification chaperone [Propylenella sp.]